MSDYTRWQKNQLLYAIEKRRVILLAGARQCGKTTLAKELVSDGIIYRSLDDQSLLEAAISDPHDFVRHHGQMMIIDEVQRVPALLPAIKKVVDEDNRPGQFLLIGSANISSLPSVRESLAGRVKKVRLRTLTQGEMAARQPVFLQNVFAGTFQKMRSDCDKDDIIDRAFQGGYPEALCLGGRDSVLWHRDYIQAILEKDLHDIINIRRQEAMQALVLVVAGWSSKFMDIAAIGSGLSIERDTLISYINALESLFVVERVLPWSQTDYARVAKRSKLFMVDSGLMVSLLRWPRKDIALNNDRLGKLIETLVFNEIAAQVDASDGLFSLYHYRDREKREIDFLVEHEEDGLLGIEVKSSSTIGKKDFKSLEWFRDNLTGTRDFIGIVLYTGQHTLSFGEMLWAVPLGGLWSC
jgi:uncharacterized protein